MCVRGDDEEMVRTVSEEPVPVSSEALTELRAALELLVRGRRSWRDAATQCVLRRWRLERLYERNHENELPGGERAAFRLVESCSEAAESRESDGNEIDEESDEVPILDSELRLLEHLLEAREKRYDSDEVRIHKYAKHSAPTSVARAIAEEASREDEEARREMLERLEREMLEQETRVADLLLRARLRQRERHPSPGM